MATAFHVLFDVIALWMIVSTALNFSSSPHWYIRNWDFPRVLVAILAASLLIVQATFFHATWWDRAISLGLIAVIAIQVWQIYPYTPLARKSVKASTRGPGDQSVRIVVSNVKMENEQHDLWMRVVREANPDVIVALEVNDRWMNAIGPGLKDYPHAIRRPQDNWYGMAVFSRLPFDGEPVVRHLVQDDIPSAHASIRLRDGCVVRLHALHPRPPEPIRDQTSAPRDAELVTMGKEIERDERGVPVVVCGDLNDVAWSHTSRLFLRLSRLLDPRRGRGFYSSFSADSRIFRFPLDHVFHSDEFRLIELRVLPYVGSDHFAMLVELSCEPEKRGTSQPESERKPGDEERANEIVEEQAEREVEGKEKGHVAASGKGG